MAAAAAAAPPVRASRRGGHHFLFIHCDGGWDTTKVFTPPFALANVDVAEDSHLATAGGIDFVSHAERGIVDSFFSSYGDRCCIINGMEVPSVAHARCRRLLLTGATGQANDWPTILAASTGADLPMPHLVITGPAYADQLNKHLVRIGRTGQLPDLLSGELLAETIPTTNPSHDDLLDAWLAGRIAEPRADRWAELSADYADMLSRHEQLKSVSSVLDLPTAYSSCARDLAVDAAAAFNCFSLGLSRCAMVQFGGWCGLGWDTHTNNQASQSRNYSDLFNALGDIMLDLDNRYGPDGRPLAQSTTIVVTSEMGRHPHLNSWGGRDHWTYTSVMLIGGLRGGQVLGGVDDELKGLRIDPSTGLPDDHGVLLHTGHLGATLMEIAGIDSGEWTDADPIFAALS